MGSIKIKSIVYLLGLICFILPEALFAKPYTTIVKMRCEYLVNPIGVDVVHPRLTWQMNDERNGARQTAYQIFVGTDSTEVANGKGTQWNSSKINSDNQLVKYDGKELAPFTVYFWRVDIWDKDGNKLENIAIAGLKLG